MDLMKKHHPIMLLTENADSVKQSLLCPGEIIDINLMKSGKSSDWVRKPIKDSMSFER